MTLLLLILLSGTAPNDESLRKLKGDEELPAALSCLPKYYVGKPVKFEGRWFHELPSGSRIPWNDGADGGVEEEKDAKDATDVEDLFKVAYVPGPIVPVVGDGDIEDPGRSRLEQLFRETYGATEAQVAERLSKVRFFGLRYPVHERALPAFERVVERLDAAVKANKKLKPFLEDIGGTWHWRTIARSRALSAHAWGIAIDLNVDRANYWRWQRPKKPLKWKNRLPQEIVDAFEAEGFIWGGRWLHYDTMHFEYRPELLDPDCLGRPATQGAASN